MKTTFYMSRRKLEVLKQAVSEMNDGVFTVSVDSIQEDPLSPDFYWVSLVYKFVDELFYLGCFSGRIEMTMNDNK